MSSGYDALTELEGAVLGVIWRRGPCTTYAVMREFEESLSASWSASSGAIYPSVRKLKEAGLIGVSNLNSRGSAKSLVLTSAGEAALRDWATEFPVSAAKVPVDPIRTRVNFLGALAGVDDRRAFLAEAAAKTEGAIRELETLTANTGRGVGPWEQAGREGALLQLRARLTWLQDLDAKLIAERP